MSGPGTLEGLLIDEWLATKLKGDATLRGLLPGATAQQSRVASPTAPADWGNGPFVTFHASSPSRDVRAIGSIRIMGVGTYVVKAVAKTNSWGTLRPAAERIDALLQGSSGNVVGGVILHCVREGEHRLTEEEDGAEWRHLGGEYRIWAQ